MSQTPDDKTEEPNASSSDDGVKPESPKDVASEKEEKISPTISAYFGPSRVSPSVFFKALKKANVLRLSKSDEAQAFELMTKNDADGERLWALMSQTNLPEAVDRWIWRAAQTRLKAVFGGNFDPLGHDILQILKEMRNAVAPHLDSKEKEERKKAENLLRIGICWLVEKRSLNPWVIAEQIRPTFFKEQSDASRTAVRAIQRGRPNEFRQAIAMAGLAQAIVEGAQQERDAEKRTAAGLRQQLGDARSGIDSLRSEITTLTAQLAKRTEALSKAQSQLEAERHHRGHDLSEAKAGQRVLLRERIAPLLSDARDALEIKPPAPQISLERLEEAISVIERAEL